MFFPSVELCHRVYHTVKRRATSIPEWFKPPAGALITKPEIPRVFCRGWTVFKEGPVEELTSLDSALESSFPPSLPVCPLQDPSPFSPRSALGMLRWALKPWIFNWMQKYIFIKNVEQCLFNSDTLYLLLNLCLGGQLTRNYLSIKFRMNIRTLSFIPSSGFKYVPYSLWFPSSVGNLLACLNLSHQRELPQLNMIED